MPTTSFHKVPASFSLLQCSEGCFSTVSEKNDIDLACYNYDDHQPILIIFGKTVAESVSYQDVIYFFVNVSATQRTMHGACSTV